jgi:hypothetical protein
VRVELVGELVSLLEDCYGSVIVRCCEKLVAETRGQFRNPEEVGTSAVRSRYQATTVYVVTPCIKESSKSDYQSEPSL